MIDSNRQHRGQGARKRLHAVGSLGGAQFRGVRMPRTNVLRLKMLQLGVDREPLLGGHRGGSQLRSQLLTRRGRDDDSKSEEGVRSEGRLSMA